MSSEKNEVVKEKTYAELVVSVGNELASDGKEFVGLDEKVQVKYLKAHGSFKKNDKRSMGIFKANVYQKQKLVKIIG